MTHELKLFCTRRDESRPCPKEGPECLTCCNLSIGQHRPIRVMEVSPAWLDEALNEGDGVYRP